MEREIHEYLMSLAGTAWDYKAEWGWERYRVGGKMYAATMKPSDVFAPEYANHPLLNLKCDPLEAEFLREQYADILPVFTRTSAIGFPSAWTARCLTASFSNCATLPTA